MYEDDLEGTGYRTVRSLGQGAMGAVVEAEHVPLRRTVVIKLIHPALADSPGFSDRFRLEAQALAALAPKTPHIVMVLDVGVTKTGRPFLVMERLAGRTLKEELDKRGFLPVAEAVLVARQLLDALRCAHEAGIIHRDVKPENIFLADVEQGGQTVRVVKLLDFGIAKVLEGGGDGPAPLAQPTAEGAALGSPRYIAPEQVRAWTVDARADIYSAGAVLYTMVAGRDPFAHVNSLAGLLTAHVMEDPSPPSKHAQQELPSWLEQAILRALAKDREHRFASAVEFAATLESGPRTLAALQTELMPVSAFRGAIARQRPTEPGPMTDRIDPSTFRGGLAPQPTYAAAEKETPVAAGLTDAAPEVPPQPGFLPAVSPLAASLTSSDSPTDADAEASTLTASAPPPRRPLVVAVVVLTVLLIAFVLFLLARAP